MPSQPDSRVGRTGARFGRVSRDEPEPGDEPEVLPTERDDRPAPTGARFGRVRRDSPEPEPEDEPFESDGLPAPIGARFGGASAGRRRGRRAARTAAARTETSADPDLPAEHPTPDLPDPDLPAEHPTPDLPDPDLPAEHWPQATPEPEWAAYDPGPEPGPDPYSAPTVRVRPYVHTGGRTRTHTPLPIEALVCAVPGSSSLRLHGTHRSVLELCQVPQSVAEVSARLAVPLAVARVLVDDLVAQQVVTVHRGVDQNAPDIALMRRVLAGLHQL